MARGMTEVDMGVKEGVQVKAEKEEEEEEEEEESILIQLLQKTALPVTTSAARSPLRLSRTISLVHRCSYDRHYQDSHLLSLSQSAAESISCLAHRMPLGSLDLNPFSQLHVLKEEEFFSHRHHHHHHHPMIKKITITRTTK